jgi:hypothetical protein
LTVSGKARNAGKAGKARKARKARKATASPGLVSFLACPELVEGLFSHSEIVSLDGGGIFCCKFASAVFPYLVLEFME